MVTPIFAVRQRGGVRRDQNRTLPPGIPVRQSYFGAARLARTFQLEMLDAPLPICPQVVFVVVAESLEQIVGMIHAIEHRPDAVRMLLVVQVDFRHTPAMNGLGATQTPGGWALGTRVRRGPPRQTRNRARDSSRIESASTIAA